MGRLQKRLVVAIAKATANSKTNKKTMMLSIVSLVLIFAVLVTSTVCWYTLQQSSGETGIITLKTDSGLRVNDLGETLNEVAKNAYMIPASSVDGRNIYFPADGDSFSNQTSEMFFRGANSGDKNYSYLQYDFELSAEENYTSIYLDTTYNDEKQAPNTYVYFQGWNSSNEAVRNQAIEDSHALRAAIYYEGIDDNTPIVFNTQKTVKTTAAVSQVDNNDGSFLGTATQTSVPFSDYSYGKRQLATMDKGEKRRFSLIIWLEGTTSECNDTLIGKKLDMNIRLTTSWENTEKILFVDNTGNRAIKNILDNNPGYALALFYDNEKHNIVDYRFNLYKDSSYTESDPVWYCNIPGNAVADLTFRIINLNASDLTAPVSVSGNVFEWDRSESKSTKNRVDSTKYIADTVGSISYGHWYDGAIEDMGGGHDIDDGDIDDGDW